jgi:hypothetical protein
MNFARQRSTKVIAIITLFATAVIVDWLNSPWAVEQVDADNTGVGSLIVPLVRFMEEYGTVPTFFTIWFTYTLAACYLLEGLRELRKPRLSEIE